MKFKLFQTLSAICMLVAVNLSGQEKTIELELFKLRQTFYNLGNYYIDTLNFRTLADEAIMSVISKLDPHSMFIPASDVKAMNEPLEGNFNGVGVEFAIIKDTLTIQGVVPGGPSEKVGIKSGDKIIKVNGEVVSGTGLTIPRVHKYLRGERGSKVMVTLRRGGVEELLDFVITRDKIPLHSVDASYMLPGNIFYIKLSRFAIDSYKEIMQSVLPVQKEMKGMILDLRGNGGGFLLAALQIANEFLSKGQLILYTEGRAMPRYDEYANGFGLLSKFPLAILIDENSASASEIVAGAVQDWDRGVVIGRRSFGKGLVQRQFDLADGSQVRVTVARYHTPSGRVIQSPYKQGDTQGYYKQFMERFSKGEYTGRDTIQFPDSLKYYTLVKKRIVYGGGGIMPDIFIPADTTYYSDYYSKLLQKGIITDFVNEYTDKNRDSLSSFATSASEFVERLDSEPASTLFSYLSAYAKERGVEYSEQDSNSVGEIVKQMRALIIRNLFDLNECYRYINGSDPEVQRAIEEIAR